MARMGTLLSQTAIYMVGLALSRGIAIALVPLYTRTLSPADFFTWDLATTTILFVLAIAELGMSSALARFYVKADSNAERRAVARTASAVAFLMLVLTVGTLLAFRGPAAVLAFGDAADLDLIDLVALIVALTVFSNLPLALLRAQERPIAFATVCFLRALVGSAFIILFVVVWGWGIKGILLGDAAGLAAVSLAGLVLNRADLVPAINRQALRDLLLFGVPLIPIGIATTIVLVSDRYFLREHVGTSEAAVYSLAFKVATLVNLVAMALQTAWAPTAFRIAKQEDAGRALADSFRMIALALGLLALAISCVAPELTRVFASSPEYAGAHRIVPWLAFSYSLQAAVLIVNTNLVIGNRTVYSTLIFCAGAVLKLFLNQALIPRYGIDGAAIATFAVFGVELVLVFVIGAAVFPVPYDFRRLGALVILLAVCAMCASWAMTFSYSVSLILRALCVVGFVLIVSFSGIVQRSELKRLRNTASGV
ncbi:MAG: oligosaccharide flippase family protein [Candidatus Hydrogenedentes bacterium]|nr:oligosaccharide flippase family protein [Candidatus Hydrogenedentota bacterium]